MGEPIPEYFPLATGWPGGDTALTVFRYALLGELCRSKRVLEIGAAAGEGTRLLADSAAEVTAVDQQDLWAQSPAAGMSNVRFVRCDALELPGDWKGRFDVVVALELVEHLDDPAAFQRQVATVLAEGGSAVFSTPNFELYSRRGDGSDTPLYVHHRREYRAEGFRAHLREHWTAVKIAGVNQLTLPDGLNEERRTVLSYGKELYELELGTAYPQFWLRKAGSLSSSPPLERCQSFLAVAGRSEVTTELPPPDVEEGEPVSMPRAEAAFRACHVILMRQNAHVADLQAVVRNREQQVAGLLGSKHAAALQGIIRDRERKIDLQRRAVEELAGVIREREEQLQEQRRSAERLEALIGEREDQLQAQTRRAGELEEAIAVREQELQSLRAHARNLQGIIANREQRLEQIDSLRRHIANLEGIVRERDGRIEHLRAQAQQLEELRAQLARCRAELARLRPPPSESSPPAPAPPETAPHEPGPSGPPSESDDLDSPGAAT